MLDKEIGPKCSALFHNEHGTHLLYHIDSY